MIEILTSSLSWVLESPCLFVLRRRRGPGGGEGKLVRGVGCGWRADDGYQVRGAHGLIGTPDYDTATSKIALPIRA